MLADNVAPFLDAFTQWAIAQPDILALALVGSHARNTATPTSDVDLVLITADPGRYLDDGAWVQQFGIVNRQQVEDYGPLISLRVWYCEGLEVEYGVTDERWSAMPLDTGTREVMAGGIRVLFERSPLLSRHLPIA